MAIALVICAQNSKAMAPGRMIRRVFIFQWDFYIRVKNSLKGISGVCSQTHISNPDATRFFVETTENEAGVIR
jgi:hypothetical protein